MWIPVTGARDIQRAYRTVRRLLIDDAEKFPKQWIGSPGGRERIDAYWRAADGIWTALPRRRGAASLSCLVGTADPRQHASLDIDVEINLPRDGVNRRYGGAFVHDETGRIFLAHSGKIGGGREGIGKHSFRDFYRTGYWQRVRWPGRAASEVVVLGPVKHPRLTAAIARFAAEVARFKTAVRSGPEEDFASAGRATQVRLAPARLAADAEAECWQDIVVSALAAALRNRALHIRVETHRTLVVAQNGAETTLFAVRPDDLAAGVGELVLSAAAQARQPRTILVVPEAAAADRSALNRLGIALLGYRWNANAPVFADLDAVL